MPREPAPKRGVEEVVAAYAKPLRPLAEELRQRVRRVLPDLVESVKWGNPSYVGREDVLYFSFTELH